MVREKVRGYFSDSLRREADSLWTKILTHPFLVEMGEGTLPLDTFRFYVKQDYAYLVEFCRCLGITVAKVEDVETMRTLASLLNASLTVEVEMLERLGEKLQIFVDELRAIEPAPTNVAYTRHLLYVAYSGTVGELIAALLPCMWSYQEVGERLITHHALKRHALYAEWCATYQSQEYLALVDWYKELVNRFASEAGVQVREKMKHHFILSSRYEYLFWDMAYRKEEWTV
jgi:thiaminase/transcriptional activator TenA